MGLGKTLRLHVIPGGMLRRISNQKSRATGILLAVGLLMLGAVSPAAAEQQRLLFWGFAGVAQKGILAEDENTSESFYSLEPGFILEGALRYQNRYTRLQSFRLETNVRTESFPDHDYRSNQRIRSRAEWRTWFSDERQTEFRLRAEHEYKLRDGDWLYHRIQGQAVLRHRLSEESLFFARGQISSRDHNEDNATGSVNLHYLAEIGHEWTPNHDWTRVRTRIGYETTIAETDRHESEGFYVGIHARHHLDDLTDVFARARARWRDYGGAFDPPDPTSRTDERFRATVGLEREIAHNWSLLGEAGWHRNQSNIEERSYSGFVFRLGVEVNVDLWRSND